MSRRRWGRKNVPVEYTAIDTTELARSRWWCDGSAWSYDGLKGKYTASIEKKDGLNEEICVRCLGDGTCGTYMTAAGAIRFALIHDGLHYEDIPEPNPKTIVATYRAIDRDALSKDGWIHDGKKDTYRKGNETLHISKRGSLNERACVRIAKPPTGAVMQ